MPCGTGGSSCVTVSPGVVTWLGLPSQGQQQVGLRSAHVDALLPLQGAHGETGGLGPESSRGRQQREAALHHSLQGTVGLWLGLRPLPFTYQGSGIGCLVGVGW